MGTGDDDYSVARADQAASQDPARIHVSPEVRGFADDAALLRWVDRMWALHCQTCGDPTLVTADLSADGDPGGDTMLLSTHHSVCRPSGVRPPGPPGSVTASFMVAMGSIDNGEPSEMPVMAFNPSCEQLLLACAPGGWRNATLGGYAALGFGRGGLFRALPRIRGIEVRMEDGHLTVIAGPPVGRRWLLAAAGRDEDPELRAEVIRRGGIATAITSSVLPRKQDFDADNFDTRMRETFASPDSLTGWVALAGTGWPSVRPGQPRPQGG